jgi:hypothetical protein
MAKTKPRYRRPTADEQTVLKGMSVRLLTRPEEVQQANQILTEHHYLHNANLVGEHLRYAVIWRGQWLAVAAWSAAAFHIKPRDQFIGWTDAQRRARLPLVANNARLYVAETAHYPNLVSRFMKLMLGRLSQDWVTTWGHPVVLAETFVDPQQFCGTTYKASGWSELGATTGWKRSAVDFYEKHDRPKQIWVRELVKNACAKLRAPAVPAAWACALHQPAPRCTAKSVEIASLMTHLHRQVPEFRRKQALAFPLAGMLALIAMATFSGVTKGYQDLADYAATLTQSQLRALRFRADPKTGRLRCPGRTTFERVLAGVDPALLEQTLLAWQAQVLGPVQDRLVIVDGKTLRHANVESVSAVSGSGRWLGSALVPVESNEIPVARELLLKLDLGDKIFLADAVHTQVTTVQQVLYQQGGDYGLTVKANQKNLFATCARRLTQQPFSPSANGAHACPDPGDQPGAAGNPGVGLSDRNAGTSGFSRRPDHRPTPPPGAAQGAEDHRNRLSHHQFDPGPVGGGGTA